MNYSVNCSTLFLDLPLLHRPAAAKNAGFDHVEFWWPFASSTPPPADIRAFEISIQDAGVQLTALNLFAGDHDAGDRGVLCDPSRSKEFRDSVSVAAVIGERLGCRLFNSLYGNVAPVSQREHRSTATQNLAYAADTLSGIGGTVLLEALSGLPAYPLTQADDVFSLIAGVRAASGATNIKMLADFYHLARNGEDVDGLIRNHATDIAHIQIADAPGRGAPGSGSLPLLDWVRHARNHGYGGAVALEYFSESSDPFAWLRDADA